MRIRAECNPRCLHLVKQGLRGVCRPSRIFVIRVVLLPNSILVRNSIIADQPQFIDAVQSIQKRFAVSLFGSLVDALGRTSLHEFVMLPLTRTEVEESGRIV